MDSINPHRVHVECNPSEISDDEELLNFKLIEAAKQSFNRRKDIIYYIKANDLLKLNTIDGEIRIRLIIDKKKISPRRKTLDDIGYNPILSKSNSELPSMETSSDEKKKINKTLSLSPRSNASRSNSDLANPLMEISSDGELSPETYKKNRRKSHRRISDCSARLSKHRNSITNFDDLANIPKYNKKSIILYSLLCGQFHNMYNSIYYIKSTNTYSSFYCYNKDDKLFCEGLLDESVSKLSSYPDLNFHYQINGVNCELIFCGPDLYKEIFPLYIILVNSDVLLTLEHFMDIFEDVFKNAFTPLPSLPI